MNERARLCHIEPVIERARRQATMLAAAAWLALAGATACSSSSAPASCPNDLPAACPEAPPTFSGGVGALIQSRCAICHSTGGINPNPLLETYDEIQAQARTAEFQVLSCLMPPAPEAPLTADERQALLGWIVCGAMND
jgi:uncharacterized membrane protein